MTTTTTPANQAKLASIAEKVRALLAKTVENGATVEEAASAAAKAQELLFKYNLDLAAFGEGPETNGYVNELHPLGAKNGVPVRWRRELFHAIAETNFCRSLHYTTGTPRMAVIGRPHDVEFVRYLYDYLAATLEAMARRDRERLLRYGGKIEWLGFLNNYGVAAALVVRKRLQDRQLEMATQDQASTALVVLSDQMLTKAQQRFYPNAKAGKSPLITTISQAAEAARMMGLEAGRQVNLNRPIEASKIAGRQLEG